MDSAYLVWPLTDDPAGAAADWLSEDLTAREHPVCRHLMESVPKARPVRLDTLGNAQTRLSFVDRIGLGMIHDELRQLLEPEFSNRIISVPLTLQGRPLAEWMGYVDPQPVWMRGSRRALCSRCPECGRIIYDPISSWNVMSGEIASGTLFGSHYGGLIVSAPLASRLLNRKWSNVSIKPLPIKTRPTDGFPEDLRQITTDQERRLAPRS